MAYGGLSSQFGMKQESTWGTAVTVDTFYEILSGTDSMYDINLIQSQGIQSGLLSPRDARSVPSTYSASGTVNIEVPDQGHFGLFQKNISGAVTGPTNIATTAYKQIHTPGVKDALSLTMQFVIPRLSDGTQVALTYPGCKFTEATYSCSTGQYLQVSAKMDGQQETTATAVAAASYTAGASVFPFKDASVFTLGGTASTTAGLTTIASGVTAATVVKSIEWTIATPMATDSRIGIGSSGLKVNQVQNGLHTLTGKMDAEFTNRTEIYDLYRSQTSTPLQIDWSHGDAGSSNPYRFQLIIPACRFTKADIQGYGTPDLASMSVEFEALLDSTGTNPLYQIYLVSKDTTL